SGLLRRFSFRITDLDYAQQRHLLAVARLATIVVPAPLLEDDDLLALRLSDDLGRNRDLAGLRQLLAVAGQQDIAQRDRVAGFSRQLLDRDLVSGGDAILLAACAHDCEHGHRFRFILAAPRR